jgi:serine/threonine protein kinase
MDVPDEALVWTAELALEMRRRVKEQQAIIGAAEFGKVDLSYRIGDGPEKVVYCEESVRHRLRIESEEKAGEAKRTPSLPIPEPEEVTTETVATRYRPGDEIDGRFEVLEVLGEGGFSRVYRVLDRVEGEERALKLFESAAGYEAVRREIGALRKIHHPNVVTVYWADKTSDGDWYLISEFIDGESLEEYVSGDRHLRDREAIDVAIDVLDALEAIHPDAVRLSELEEKRRGGDLSQDEFHEMQELQEHGLVHRDIKPLNIILTRHGAKLLDFNIASRAGDPVKTLSGTPPFQAPDADYTRWDVTTDLFAVGVVLYELLCNGQHPYPGGKPMVREEVLDPRSFRPDLSADLAKFLVKACAPDRNDRFDTAQEMMNDLQRIRTAW